MKKKDTLFSPTMYSIAGASLQIFELMFEQECEFLTEANKKAQQNKLLQDYHVENGLFCDLISLAIICANVDIINRLLHTSGVGQHQLDKHTPSMVVLAMTSVSADVCDIVLRNGADIAVVNDDGDTPLHLAVKKGCCNFLSTILNLRKDSVDLQIALLLINNDKKDPLTLALESLHPFAKTLQNCLRLAGAKPADVSNVEKFPTKFLGQIRNIKRRIFIAEK